MDSLSSAATASWFRQFQVLLTKNRKLILRRPIHLLVLLLSSVVSVVFAWLAGRDERGPSGDFPPLNDCGMVDALYYEKTIRECFDREDCYDIPISLNEPWRDGLPIWLMTLGPTFSGISAFLILRDELQSKRWGMLKAADPSAHWLSWLFAFVVLGIVNSLAGGITAAALPNIHALESVSFGPVFGSLLFLNSALVAASFFLAALCGTIRSLTLTVFIIMGMIVASSVPVIAAASSSYYNMSASAASDTWSTPSATGGAFWLYGSTERTKVDSGFEVDDNEASFTTSQCQNPLVSFDQGRNFKTEAEREDVTREDIFEGCYTIQGASSVPRGARSFFWYLIPHYHFMAAWSNIVGYTSLPGNKFSIAEASQSPEELATKSLMNYKGGEGYDQSNTNVTSGLFPQGSTILVDYPYNPTTRYNYDEFYEPTSNCPPTSVSNLCDVSTSAQCYTLKQGYDPSTGSPSLNDTLGYLVSLVVIYSILAAYTAAVIPMANGAAMKFYFPFQWSYWFGNCRHSSGDVHDGVEAIGVSKRYGKVEALQPFNLTMKPSEVTALLGHNGAGKSTFVNMLSGEQNPTSGDIRVQGHSVASDHRSICKLIGECKQDDILWGTLTARDHLELMAGIRAVSKDKMTATVQHWLESVDLDSVQHVRASTFSGGMKRRLSVALATIGNARVIVLDEPTTGMDPVSRRYVWKHISEIKAGRTILLTTHAMEEADLLADHVAILNHGALAALGSPLELKTKYGSALQFSLICEKENVSVVEMEVNTTFSDSLEHVTFQAGSGNCTITIKKVCKDPESFEGEGVAVASLSAFIKWLEDEHSPVQEFGISNSSLEEVFLAVTNHDSGGQSASDRRGHCCCCRRNRPKTTSEETVTMDSPNALPTPSPNLNHLPKVNMSSYSRKLSIKIQTKAIVRFLLARNWTGRPSLVNWTFFSIFCVGNMMSGFGMAVSWPDQSLKFYLIVPVSLMSTMLISIISPMYSDRNAGLDKMLATQSMLESSYLLGTSVYSLVAQFTYSFVLLTLFFGSTVFRTARRPDCDYNDDYECGYAKFGGRPVLHPSDREEVLSGISSDGNQVSVFAHVAAGNYGMIFGIICIFSLTLPGAVLSSAFLPGHKISLIGVSFVLLAACVSPLILYIAQLLDPFFFVGCTKYIQSSSLESQFTLDNANKEFVELIGLRMSDPYLYCTPSYVSILPQMGLFNTLSLTLMSDIVFYSEPEDYANEFIAKLVEGGASCSGNRCKFDYARQLYGKNLGYMVLGAIILTILGLLMATFMIYPSPCMIRGKHALSRFRSFICCWNRHQEDLASPKDIDEMKEVDTERQHVHSIMQPCLVEPADVEANNSTVPILSYSAINDNRDQFPPVIMHKLRKVFPPLGGAPPKIALKSLDLHVPRGQTLGLLGKNGAGKTTALKILAGMHEASSGIGLISGYDVESQLNSVYERLGNCPQFDCVWKDQSVQRHLEFYAQLKGISDPSKASIDIANAVGLGAPGVYTRPSGALSGGMRRRLSIAISLLGAPETLLLDEPTTGLDPSTRNEIWSLVSSFATPERAVIITTHMMLEADTLCSRIAIVAKGSLKVVGTQQHLKDNYGSGYLLQLNLTHDNEQAVNSLLKFVKSNIHDDAKIVTKQAKTVHINLPRDVNIQKIFTTLYSDSATEAMINQFLVSQSSLEDVFLALGE